MHKLVKQLLTVLITISLTAAGLQADVKQDIETKVVVKGPLGSMMKVFGGNKPKKTTTYLKGNLQRTDTYNKKGKVTNSQVVDLNRGVFISMDWKKKKYTEMTFEEWREMLNSGLASVFNPEKGESKKSDEPATEVDFSIKVDVETPGDTKKIAGYNTENIILNLKVEVEATQKDEDPQKMKGGMIVRSTNWMASSVDGGDEIRAFALKLAEKLGMEAGAGGFTDAIAKLLQNNKQLGEAMAELKKESSKLSGTPMHVHTVFETWGQKMDAGKGDDEEAQMPKSIGGLLKGFGKKKMDKKDDGGANVLLETTTKINKHSTAPLASDLFDVPANFKREQITRK